MNGPHELQLIILDVCFFLAAIHSKCIIWYLLISNESKKARGSRSQSDE